MQKRVHSIWSRYSTHALTLSAFLVAASSFGCGGDSSDDSASEDLGALSGQITEAVDYISASLPELSNEVGATLRTRKPVHARSSLSVGPYSTNFITPTVWGTNTGAVVPVGGPVQAGETYNGVAIPSAVNYRDYMKFALDPAFSRNSSGGTSTTYRPTVFGRFDQLVDIMTYVEQSGVPTNANGVPDAGTYSFNLTIDGTELALAVTVSNTTSTTNYDRKLDVYAFLDTDGDGVFDTGETKVFHTLLWVKSTSSQLNLMAAELSDQTSDGTPDVFTLNMLNWNRSSGNLRFERVSNPNDSLSGAEFDTSRILINSTGGKAWVYAMNGIADTAQQGGNFMQWGVYTPTSSGTEGTFSIREVRSNGDIWMGNLCAIFATGVGSEGAAIDGDADPTSGGTCSGQTDALNIKGNIMYPGFSVRGHSTWVETATAKGFPAAANPDWSTDAARSAWLTAGEAVTAGFTNRTEFIGNF